MRFTSFEFIAFISVLFLLYYLLPRKCQFPLLILFSFAFYATYSVAYIPLMVFTAATTWASALLISKRQAAAEEYIAANRETMTREERKDYKAEAKRRARKILVVCLIVNFGIFAFLKYADFTLPLVNAFIHNISTLADPAGGGGDLYLSLMLPLGMSFYVFMLAGYLVDVYRGKYAADKSFWRVMLFTSYFPQLLQGPFSRYDEAGKTLFESHGFDGGRFSSAVLRITWGYFKKLVLADRVSIALVTLFGAPETYRGAYVVAAIILYSLRIYADFTGGIDIVLGISEALGIKLKENFILPYFSKSIAEYWRRWHITLGEWFREYIFYPLSICKPLNKLAKKLKPRLGAGFAKRLPVYIATIITWFVTGIWHGAAWNFIAWGMTNCVVILISEELSPLYEKFHSKTGIKEDGAYGAFMMLRTYLLMGMIRMFDCYASVPKTISAVGSIFTTWNPSVLFDGSMLAFGLSAADYIVLALGAALIFTVSVISYRGRSVRERLESHPWLRFAATFALAAAVLVFGSYGLGYNAVDFIYNF